MISLLFHYFHVPKEMHDQRLSLDGPERHFSLHIVQFGAVTVVNLQYLRLVVKSHVYLKAEMCLDNFTWGGGCSERSGRPYF